jgi:hypothetical protein
MNSYYLDISLLRKISGRQKVAGNLRNVPIVGPHNFLIFIPSIIRGSSWKIMKLIEHATCMARTRNTYSVQTENLNRRYHSEELGVNGRTGQIVGDVE